MEKAKLNDVKHAGVDCCIIEVWPCLTTICTHEIHEITWRLLLWRSSVPRPKHILPAWASAYEAGDWEHPVYDARLIKIAYVFGSVSICLSTVFLSRIKTGVLKFCIKAWWCNVYVCSWYLHTWYLHKSITSQNISIKRPASMFLSNNNMILITTKTEQKTKKLITTANPWITLTKKHMVIWYRHMISVLF